MIVFKQKSYIIVTKTIDDPEETLDSWVYHYCSGYGITILTDVTELEMRDNKCMSCHSSATDEILALWRLHNWDYNLGSYSNSKPSLNHHRQALLQYYLMSIKLFIKRLSGYFNRH